MTTSDHRHSNTHKETNNGHHSNDNNSTKDAEIDSGILKKKKQLFNLIFF
jgi:hypothetical protein